MIAGYKVRRRLYCMGSNTVPSASERDEALANERRFQCQGCGRTVTLTRNGLVPTHLTKAPGARGGAR